MLDEQNPEKGKSKSSFRSARFDGLEMPTKYKPLEPQKELSLAYAYRDGGDDLAGKKLVLAYTFRAKKMAGVFWKKYGGDFRDYESEANIGLMKALEKFDPDKGFRFGTYATWWIKASLQDYVMRNNSLVRVGTTSDQKKLFFNLRRERAQISTKNPNISEYEVDEIAAKNLGVDVETVQEMRIRMENDYSLNAPQGDEEGSREWIDGLEDENANNASEAADLESMRGIFAKAVENLKGKKQGGLNDRHIEIIRLRRFEEKTLEDTAEIISVSGEKPLSKERVRQLEVQALERILDEIAVMTGIDVDKSVLKTNKRRSAPSSKSKATPS